MRVELHKDKERRRRTQRAKEIEGQKARLSFMEMKEGLQILRVAAEKTQWDQARSLRRGLKDKLDDLKLHQKRESVTRKRDLAKFFEAECRGVARRAAEDQKARDLLLHAPSPDKSPQDGGGSVLNEEGVADHRVSREECTPSPEELKK